MTQQGSGTTALTTIGSARDYLPIIRIVTDGLTSRHSVRAYEQGITHFMAWRDERGAPTFTKALVNAYKRQLVDDGLSPSTVNQRLSAIRRLAQEAADNGMIDASQAVAIARVRGVKTAGVRAGDWLTAEEAQATLEAPNGTTSKATRDRAVLAVLLGAGLRRTECAQLEVRHLAERDGRPVIVDLVGKGRRVRTVPIAPWISKAVTDWLELAGITTGKVFRRLSKAGRTIGDGLTPQAIMLIVAEYAPAGIAPHDLRRTFARLSYSGGAALEQVSANLGHASLLTTQRYLGVNVEYTNGKTPSDRLPFGL
jgi:site-specific recombinase XerD